MRQEIRNIRRKTASFEVWDELSSHQFASLSFADLNGMVGSKKDKPFLAVRHSKTRAAYRDFSTKLYSDYKKPCLRITIDLLSNKYGSPSHFSPKLILIPAAKQAIQV
jgi:hypothetical protein